MAEIPKGLAEFLARDLVFMTGGSAVVASFLYWIDRLPDKHTPSAYYLLALGISYAVGFALQELFSLFGVVTTRNVYRPNRVLQQLFRRYDHAKWKDVSQTDDSAVRRVLRGGTQSDKWWASHQRIITHMMIGSTLTPCAVVSAVLLFVTWWSSRDPEEIKMALASLALAFVMWPFGWLKAMQMTVREVELVNPDCANGQGRV